MISVAKLSDVDKVLPLTLMNLGILVSQKITDDLYIQNIIIFYGINVHLFN